MKRLVLVAAFIAACGGNAAEPAKAPSITEVVVVLKGSSEPLPFDPRGGRITIVTQEIARLIGHPITLELDTALSPELKASLEETVLASFETIARELVLLQREEPDMFAKARTLERVVCTYDAVAKESEGVIDGKILSVRSPPDRFPLLEKWVVTQAVYRAHIGDLEARWGEADPTKLAAREQAAYFDYMMTTRPGAGYLWIAARGKKPGGEGKRDDSRVEHVGRIVRLAGAVEPASPLARKVRRFLLESAPFVVGLSAERRSSHADPAIIQRVVGSYEGWLNQNVPSFDDEERMLLHRALIERRSGEAVLARFDRFAFGLSIYDAWVKDGARVEPPLGPRGELFKAVVCPHKRRGEAETTILSGCSAFFASTFGEDAQRTRLSETITKRRDLKLLETALMNLGTAQGPQALALIESLKDDALFRLGVNILFHDFARRDDVTRALEEAAPRWWRDTPGRRGLALLVMARRWEDLHVHYGDNQWTRFVAEFGGPVTRDVFTSYLAEGPRAIEMTPKIWPALTKGSERDELVARSLPALLTRDREARSSRARPALVLLRTRLCGEKNATGLATVRSSIERWAKANPEDAPSVSNALADFTLARCAKPAEPDLRD